MWNDKLEMEKKNIINELNFKFYFKVIEFYKKYKRNNEY